jgi:hypothetical protein
MVQYRADFRKCAMYCTNCTLKRVQGKTQEFTTIVDTAGNSKSRDMTGTVASPAITKHSNQPTIMSSIEGVLEER